MRVLIFGSTGSAGRYILAELLARGHDVTAFVRSRNRIDAKLVSSPKLTIVEGDILTESDIKRAFTTASASGNLDAVISSISEGLEIKLHLQSKGNRLIADSINHCTGKKPRFIVFAGAGMLDVPIKDDSNPDEIKTQFWKYTSDYGAMYRPVSDEHETIYNMIREEANLEWTLLFPPLITDEEADDQFVVAKNVFPSSNGKIKAGNLARFIVNELTERKLINTRVGISNI